MSEFDHALDECLDRVLVNGEPVEDCLRRYPQHASELAPLLRLALETSKALDFKPSGAARAKARLLLDAALARQQARQKSRWRWPRLPRLSSPPRWAVSAAAAVIVMAMGGSGIVAASSDSLPDQPLYPVKRVVEQARLVFTFGGDAKARLHSRFAERRVLEIAVMSNKGNTKRIASLTDDLDRHLRRVGRSAFPEGIPVGRFQTPVPVVPPIATPLGGAPGEAQEPQGVRPPQPRPGELVAEWTPLPPKLERSKRALRQHLLATFTRQERELIRAIRQASGPNKQMLQLALLTLRQHRDALLATLDEQLSPQERPTSALPRYGYPNGPPDLPARGA